MPAGANIRPSWLVRSDMAWSTDAARPDAGPGLAAFHSHLASGGPSSEVA